MAASNKFVPGSTADSEEIFSYPFFNEDESKDFIKNHGRIMFIIRGPPGTGKKSLTDLIKKHFPSGVRCSADDFFSDTFNASVRTRNSLKESHDYCHQSKTRVQKRYSPNNCFEYTHMKKREMQEYLNYAMEYEYTVIITSTLDKFKVSPEILAKSNTKGLDESYFKKRLQAWQEVFPNLMGWFLCADDSFFVLQQLKFALDTLLGDGRFCRVFDAFDLDTLLGQFKAKKMLCCPAGFMKTSPFELKDYYKSEEVKNSYGRCFSISIQAFVVTKTDIFAIVLLDNNLKKLTLRSCFEVDHTTKQTDDLDSITKNMQTMSVRGFYNFKLIPLKNDFSQKCKSAKLMGKTADFLNVHDITFIHLAQKEEKQLSTWELNIFLKEFLSDIFEPNGDIKRNKFSELDNGYRCCRLHCDGWIINLPQNISFKTVFTGLYT